MSKKSENFQFDKRTVIELSENCIVIDMPVAEARKLVCEDDELEAALDEAQGEVFTGSSPFGYVLIRIHS